MRNIFATFFLVVTFLTSGHNINILNKQEEMYGSIYADIRAGALVQETEQEPSDYFFVDDRLVGLNCNTRVYPENVGADDRAEAETAAKQPEPAGVGEADEMDIYKLDISDSDVYEEIMQELDIDELSSTVNELPVGVKLDIQRLLTELINGNSDYVSKVLAQTIREALFGEIFANKTLMVQLLAIVLLGSVFVNISNNFGSGFVSENGFYVTYLMMTSIIFTSFSITLDIVNTSINHILGLIKIIAPVYALAMNFIGQTVTSAGMYEVVLVGGWLVQVVIIRFIIPLIKFYVILSLINNLNKEDTFSKLCKLLLRLASWLLKTIIVFVAGLNIIKGLIEPQIDAFGRSSVNKLVSVIPGGGVMSVLTGTFLGAGLVVKNSIGVMGIIVIGVAVLIPVIKTLLLFVIVRITAALVQPVGDKRYSDGIDALAQGLNMLLQALACSVVIFVLSIAIVAFSSNV